MGDKRSLIVPGFGIEKIQQLKIDLKSPHGMKPKYDKNVLLFASSLRNFVVKNLMDTTQILSYFLHKN